MTDQPGLHIMNMGVGHDLNSILHWKGVWHIMHQATGPTGHVSGKCLASPCRSLGKVPIMLVLRPFPHLQLVSTDLRTGHKPSVLSRTVTGTAL